MKETLDFIKIGDMCVINLNNMIPVSQSELTIVDFSHIKDIQYKRLLIDEYRLIKKKYDTICKNARIVYSKKIHEPNSSLAKRCCDFQVLEVALSNWVKEKEKLTIG